MPTNSQHITPLSQGGTATATNTKPNPFPEARKNPILVCPVCDGELCCQETIIRYWSLRSGKWVDIHSDSELVEYSCVNGCKSPVFDQDVFPPLP